MSGPVIRLTLRLRLQTALSAAFGLVVVMLMVGALFPSVGHTIGTLKVPQSVLNLLGGADYGTITGWFRSEIAVIYGPLVVGAIAIIGAVGSVAGDEEARITALVLAHPIARHTLLLSQTVAIALTVVVTAVGCWLGLIVGVAVGGGGISLGHITAACLSLTAFAFATGAVGTLLAGVTGHKGLASGLAAAVGIGGWLINSFAPLVHAISWLRYISPFYYYARHGLLSSGVDLAGVLVLLALALACVAGGALGFAHRDLRG